MLPAHAIFSLSFNQPFIQKALIPFIRESYLIFNTTQEALTLFSVKKTLAQSRTTLDPD